MCLLTETNNSGNDLNGFLFFPDSELWASLPPYYYDIEFPINLYFSWISYHNLLFKSILVSLVMPNFYNYKSAV